MWRPLFGDASADEVPITHVTNGVHLPTFLSPPMRALLDRHLGEGWLDRASDPETWAPVDAIPDEELWAARNDARRLLVDYVKVKSVQDRLLRGEDPDDVMAVAETFAEDTLTLGFARRIATYKRLFLLDVRPGARAADPRRRPAAPARGRRQGAPARRQREADARRRVRALAVRGHHVPGRVPRELRPLGRAADRRRLRRLAQRPAAAARGERDERDEVRGQRRPQPERARRLVGRGLRRRERLGDRRARPGGRGRGGSGRAPRERALRHPRAAGDPALPRSRRGRHPPALARDGEALAADERPALLGRADGRGVRGRGSTRRRRRAARPRAAAG